MKKLFLSLIFFSVVFLSSPVFANNYLSNPNFESDFLNWTVLGPNWEAQGDFVNEGAVSVKNTIAIGTVDYFAGVQQIIPITPAAAPKLWAKINSKVTFPKTSKARAGVLLVFRNSANQEISRTQDIIGGDTAWRTLFIETTVPAGTTKVEFLAFVFAPKTDTPPANAGQAFFDVAVLSKDALSGHPTALINGNFENGTSDWNEFSFDIPADAITDPAFVQQGAIAAGKRVNTATGREYFGQIYQDIYLNAAGGIYPTNTFINARGFVKPNFNPAKRTLAGIQFEFFNANNVAIGTATNKFVEGTSAYRELYISGRTPAGTKFVRLSGIVFANAADAPAGGTAYFDNFTYSRTQFTGYPKPVTNLINANFANGLSDWQDRFFPATVSETIFRGTKYAAKLMVTNAVSTQDFYSEIAQTIDVTPGRVIQRARVYAQSTLKTAVGELRLEFLDANGALLPSFTRVRTITGNSAWKELAILNVTVPDGAVKMRFIGSLFAPKGSNSVNDTVYFDDALIQYAP